MLFATLVFEDAFFIYSEKGFAILIKSWKITFGAKGRSHLTKEIA
ncbi:hypothetical protein QUB68_07050 [Microcoleus sp. A006_D1]